MNAIDLLQRLWMASLAATAALAAVGLLRRSWRRAFGAEQACRLWWLPVLAVLASQLPHPSTVMASPPVWLSLHWQDLPAAPVVATTVPRMPLLLLAAWLAGAVLMLGWEGLRQYRFMRRLVRGRLRVSQHEGVVLWLLHVATQGPSLVGCWRPRIVLPADFERRYDAAERALILAHERMHARRRDLPGLLLAACLRGLFWFHPLAWWAVRCLRQDQELACDAALLRTRIASPRRYADTLLKTQLNPPDHAPIGCAWHNHPVKERIAMLKQACPNLVRRSAGAMVAVLLATGLVGTVYANTSKPGQASVSAASEKAGAQYQLSMVLDINDQEAGGDHDTRADLNLCLRSLQHAKVFVRDVHVKARVKPLSGHRMQVALQVTGKGMDKPASVQLAGKLGHPMRVEMTSDGASAGMGTRRIAVDVTPILGCPARNNVSQKMHKVSVRDAATTVAAKAGYVLDNPGALSMRPVSFDFEAIPVQKAMHLLARVDGKRAVFDGNHVRIESH